MKQNFLKQINKFKNKFLEILKKKIYIIKYNWKKPNEKRKSPDKDILIRIVPGT